MYTVTPRNILKKSSSWDLFRDLLRGLSPKEKGDCFESLTYYFLKLHPEHTTSVKNVWHLKDVPHNVRKHLNLPQPDEGIDLIAETKEGAYWAIQCKYREDEIASLTRKELATFTDLTFTICKNIELALVCTNAERFSHKLTRYGERLSFCSSDVWRSLDNDFFSRLHALLANKPKLLKPFVPRPHQKKALEEAERHFIGESNTRGKLIMPCASGKSHTGWWLKETLKAKSVLVAVPSLALVKQTLEKWAREAVATRQDIRWIAVCSDETVAQDDRDDAVVLVQDLGVRVHTDFKDIAQWLKYRHQGPTVVFATYQSGMAIAEAARKANIIFDLGIFDEAHKTVGKKGSLFDYLLHEKNIKIRKRVFMTATERRYKGDSENILSMDDPVVYGDTFDMLSFKTALECKPPILSDYKIVTVAITQKEIEMLIKANFLVRPDRGAWNKEVEAEMLCALVALRKAMRDYPIKHAVSFHSSIARASAFRESQDFFTSTFPEFGRLETFHVTGSTPTAIRKQVLDAFESAERSLVTNARCLTEGVDVPRIDCVLFADPKRSTVDIVQAVGRALRPAEGKKLGYVIVPILMNATGKVEETSFDNVLMILRALASNDERIIEYFRTISQGAKHIEGSLIDILVPEGVMVNTNEFIESIALKTWSRLAKLSWRPFEEARSFIRNINLGSNKDWRLYCKGKLQKKGFLPKDIPTNPDKVYADTGWLHWGDWLGTGTIASRLRRYRPFEEARTYVRKLKLHSSTEWYAFVKGKFPEKGSLPDDIPVEARNVYKNQGWVNFGDWLGTGTIAPHLRKYRSFNKARAYARSLKLQSSTEWRDFAKEKFPEKGRLPDDVPASPHKTYTNKGWKNWGDWLGTGNIALFLKKYRSFKKARAYIRTLGIKNTKEWMAFCAGKLLNKGKLPDDIPATPGIVYKNQGWINLGDWLGTGTIATWQRKYWPFEEARTYARKLKLKNAKEWSAFAKGKMPEKGVKPNDIPASVDYVYKNNGWKGWGDWLGTGNVALFLKKYRSFKKARAYVRSLKLESSAEWSAFVKGKMPEKGVKPNDIPADPRQVYKNQGWINLGDWLGTGTIAPRLREYRPFEEARAHVRILGLKNFTEWRFFCRGKMSEKGLKPDDIPADAYHVYKNQGWISWGDWLGTEAVSSRLREYRPFKESRAYIRRLRLQNRQEWRLFCKGSLAGKSRRPRDIPAKPDEVYKSKGWVSWDDWFGAER